MILDSVRQEHITSKIILLLNLPMDPDGSKCHSCHHGWLIRILKCLARENTPKPGGYAMNRNLHSEEKPITSPFASSPGDDTHNLSRLKLFTILSTLLAMLLIAPVSPWANEIYPLVEFTEWGFAEVVASQNRVYYETIRCLPTETHGEYGGWTMLQGLNHGLHYWIRIAEDGVYMKNARRKFPILGTIQVVFDPPIPFIKLPLQADETWVYEGTARTWIKDRRIRIRFHGVGWEYRESRNWTGKAWRVDSETEAGKNASVAQTAYYAPRIGYIGGGSPDAQTWLIEHQTPDMLHHAGSIVSPWPEVTD
jgi:hypothetical protein